MKMMLTTKYAVALMGLLLGAHRASSAPIPPTMVRIPSGTFTMGNSFTEDGGGSDELPLHRINVSTFYIDRYETSKQLWDEVRGWALDRGYTFDNAGFGKAPTHPVHSINWYDCIKWCNARSEKEGFTPTYYTDSGLQQVYRSGRAAPFVKWNAGYRLPTEAEWEKAARGGAEGRRFSWPDADTISHSRANYSSSWSGGRPTLPYDINPVPGFHPSYSSGLQQVYRSGRAAPFVKWNAGYRLPTEAEWEKAARGGAEGRRFSWPDADTISHSRANYSSSWSGGRPTLPYDINPVPGFHPSYSSGPRPLTSPVGAFTPNGYGLHEMSGNVAEWCFDWYGNTYYSTPTMVDPRGPLSGLDRVIRGGGWDQNASYLRVARRGSHHVPTYIHDHTGFRTALSNPFPEWVDGFEMVTVPTQPTYSPCLEKLPGKENLIVVTHGWNPDPAWVIEMTNAISQYLIANSLHNWQVHAYMWVERANTLFPDDALDNGKEEGVIIGSCLIMQDWSHIHFIAYSAGSALIQTATEVIKNAAENMMIHETFLDAFVGFDKSWVTRYGYRADWVDSYFSHDVLSGGELWPYTEGPLEHAYNVEVTWVDNGISGKPVYFSTASGLQTCSQGISRHEWPREFYANTIPPSIQVGASGFGFPLSKEGGGWNFATSTYIPGPNTLKVLGEPSSSSCNQSLYQTTAAVLGPVFYQTLPTIESGVVQLFPNGFKATTHSPSWIAVLTASTNAINFVSFDSEFISETRAAGLLTVLWDTNVIGAIDELAVQSGLRHYTFSFPRTLAESTHMLGFRIDSYTAGTPSSVVVTNVNLGIIGPYEPFTLSVLTNTSKGLLFQLTGQSGFNYNVDASTNLVDWETVAVLVNTNGAVLFVDTNSATAPARFYRAVSAY